MNSRIIYPTDEGVAIIIPAPECGLTIEANRSQGRTCWQTV
jgi:hypothetical protein